MCKAVSPVLDLDVTDGSGNAGFDHSDGVVQVSGFADLPAVAEDDSGFDPIHGETTVIFVNLKDLALFFVGIDDDFPVDGLWHERGEMLADCGCDEMGKYGNVCNNRPRTSAQTFTFLQAAEPLKHLQLD